MKMSDYLMELLGAMDRPSQLFDELATNDVIEDISEEEHKQCKERGKLYSAILDEAESCDMQMNIESFDKQLRELLLRPLIGKDGKEHPSKAKHQKWIIQYMLIYSYLKEDEIPVAVKETADYFRDGKPFTLSRYFAYEISRKQVAEGKVSIN